MLVVSLVLSTTIHALQSYAERYLQLPAVVFETANALVTYLLLIVLFALLYRVLPDVDIPWRDVWLGAVVTALLLSVGIIGATVMPHAVYLHSGLTQARMPVHDDNERRTVLRFSNQEVILALSVAGLVNMAMVMMASSAFHAGHPEVAEIETAYHTLTPLLGIGAAGVFLVSLIASGVASSTVGTMAGQMIMQGFIGFRIPVWVRRLVTMLPALVVVALGVNATNALVTSQVVLSIALPLPMIALLIFTGRRDIMGVFVNGAVTRIGAWAATVVVLTLNFFLIVQTLGVAIPGLPDAR